MTIEQYPSSNNIATTTVWKYTATGSELTLSGYDNYSQALQFTTGSEQVYLNGVLLVRNLDYTPNANGLSITFPTQLSYNDFVQIYCYSNYSIASVASSSITGTIQNAQLSNSSITFGNQTISLGGTLTTPTGLSISGSTNTLTNIPNSALSNSNIIINGTPISLGGTVNITTPNTILSQKGGLIVGTGAGSVAQVTPGANGTIFTASSSQSSGTIWSNTINLNGTFGVDISGNITNTGNINASGSLNSANYLMSGKNVQHNGAFDIWQRNTTFNNSANSYTADRWGTTINMGGAQVNVTQSTDIPNANFTYSANMSPTSAVTSAAMVECAFRSWQELNNVKHLTGQYVTVSFWYKSSIAGLHKVRFASYGASVNGGTGAADVTNTFTVTSANTWQYVSVVMNTLVSLTSWGTTALNGAATFMDIGFQNGTALASTDYLKLTGVQVEAGSIATPFSRAGGNIATELSICQRYYQLRLNAFRAQSVNGQYQSSQLSTVVEMRTPPTVTLKTTQGRSATYSGAVIITPTYTTGTRLDNYATAAGVDYYCMDIYSLEAEF